MPFLIAAFVFTLAMFYYEWQWKKKNPWWNQTDSKMRLSPVERAYRQDERRKHDNAVMCWVVVILMVIGLMIVTLMSRVNGNFLRISHYWFCIVPIFCAIMLAFSGFQHRK